MNENQWPHASCKSETLGWSTTALHQHHRKKSQVDKESEHIVWLVDNTPS